MHHIWHQSSFDVRNTISLPPLYLFVQMHFLVCANPFIFDGRLPLHVPRVVRRREDGGWDGGGRRVGAGGGERAADGAPEDPAGGA